MVEAVSRGTRTSNAPRIVRAAAYRVLATLPQTVGWMPGLQEAPQFDESVLDHLADDAMPA
jgi:hypothetical protein